MTPHRALSPEERVQYLEACRRLDEQGSIWAPAWLAIALNHHPHYEVSGQVRDNRVEVVTRPLPSPTEKAL